MIEIILEYLPWVLCGVLTVLLIGAFADMNERWSKDIALSVENAILRNDEERRHALLIECNERLERLETEVRELRNENYQIRKLLGQRGAAP